LHDVFDLLRRLVQHRGGDHRLVNHCTDELSLLARYLRLKTSEIRRVDAGSSVLLRPVLIVHARNERQIKQALKGLLYPMDS
jgi:hypothetical protein